MKLGSLVLAFSISAGHCGCESSTTQSTSSQTAAVGKPPQLDSSPQSLLEEYIHFVLIDKPAIASAFYEALMRSTSDVELAVLIDKTLDGSTRRKFEAAIQAAAKKPDLEATATGFRERLDRGRHELNRPPS